MRRRLAAGLEVAVLLAALASPWCAFGGLLVPPGRRPLGDRGGAAVLALFLHFTASPPVFAVQRALKQLRKELQGMCSRRMAAWR